MHWFLFFVFSRFPATHFIARSQNAWQCWAPPPWDDGVAAAEKYSPSRFYLVKCGRSMGQTVRD